MTGLLGVLAAALLACVLMASPAAAQGLRSGGPPVVVTDQAADAVLLLDGERTRWSWSVIDDLELADLDARQSWPNPSEAKTQVLNGRQYLLAAASGGLAAVVGYPGGEVYWATDVGGENAHSLELLPDGDVAVVASTPGFVRL
ncbi:DUF6528 family protein [Streptomyces sp. NPDC051554]|uniref:DUF6528 family protein n=1 Tax=Streptomyces sp. NPDC051554 TaxID=3365656 RepID=UPI003796392C